MELARFIVNKLMAGWLILFAIIALLAPGPFTVLTPYVNYILGGVIFIAMLTAEASTLGRVFSRPKALIAGFVIKWATVPLAAYIAANLVYSHNPQLAAGTIVDGSTPAGVSSNLFAYIGHGAVELAVSLTFIHTLLAPLLTPAFTQALASKFVHVSFWSLFKQMLEIVVLPVVLGLAVRYGIKPERTRKAEPVLPMISAILLYLVVLGLFSKAAPAVRAHLGLMPVIIGTTTVLIVVNLLVAYLLARLAKLDDATARTIMFDTGVYNSGLGSVIAAANFGPFAALPALMNTIMNLIIGALASSWLQHHPTAASEPAPESALQPAAGQSAGPGYERS
ncbi:MAG TPA: bile acid:sodium symporter family protein [Trebonia sp.]|nr:bile acid:sodium symporter family protein [Trebonia sp.]